MSELAASSQKQRNYGIDLAKILSMLMIVILHILGIGRAAIEPGQATFPSWFASECIRIACYGAVNCFAMASGYLMRGKQFNAKNPLGVWCSTIFYTLAFTLLFQICMPETVGLKEWIKAMLPVTFRQYWYVTAYITMCCFIPLMLTSLEKISLKSLSVITGVILLFSSVLSTLNDVLYLNAGYSTGWLLVMFILGYFLARLERGTKHRWLYLIGYFAFVGITFLSTVILRGTLGATLGIDPNRLVAYNSPTIVLATICLFRFLVSFSVNAKPAQKIIAWFSSLTLGVYLIHTNPFIYHYLLANSFSSIAQYSVLPWAMALLGSAIGIFLVCALMEYGRKALFGVLKPEKHILSLFHRVSKNFSKHKKECAEEGDL